MTFSIELIKLLFSKNAKHFCIFLCPVRGTVEEGVSQVRLDRQAAFLADLLAPPPAAPSPVDRVRRLYRGDMVHPASSIDVVSRGKYRANVCINIIVVIAHMYISTTHYVDYILNPLVIVDVVTIISIIHAFLGSYLFNFISILLLLFQKKNCAYDPCKSCVEKIRGKIVRRLVRQIVKILDM